MEQYTIYCTAEQTKKALELGAPIKLWEDIPSITPATGYYLEDSTMFALPTAEQMIGWLEEQVDEIDACKKEDGTWFYIFYPSNTIVNHIKEGFSSRKEATLAAIDVALDYLIKMKK